MHDGERDNLKRERTIDFLAAGLSATDTAKQPNTYTREKISRLRHDPSFRKAIEERRKDFAFIDDEQKRDAVTESYKRLMSIVRTGSEKEALAAGKFLLGMFLPPAPKAAPAAPDAAQAPPPPKGDLSFEEATRRLRGEE